MNTSSLSTLTTLDSIDSERSSAQNWIVRHGKTIMIVLLVAILLGALFWFATYKKSEVYKPLPVHLIDQEQVKQMFQHDFDGYASSLNQVNLEACGVADKEDLIAKWTQSVAKWTTQDQKLLQDAAQIADYAINMQLQDPFKAQMNSIQWKIAKTIHPYYLDGLPHTRGDIIFLTDKILSTSSPSVLARILVHEKVHLWQRKYPKEMEGWMQRIGFNPVKLIQEDPLQRSNPDVNKMLYSDSQQNLLGVRFRNANPMDLHDVDYVRKMDHPYELFAYQVEKIIDKIGTK